MGEDENGKPQPIGLPFDAASLDILQGVRERVAQDLDQRSVFLLSWRGKSAGRLLRIAHAMELLQWSMEDRPRAFPSSITNASTVRALKYLEYLDDMVVRVAAEAAIDDVSREAAWLARWISRHEPEQINERDLYQRGGFTKLREASVRGPVFKLLEEAGWIRQAQKAGRAGRRPGNWDVNPASWGSR